MIFEVEPRQRETFLEVLAIGSHEVITVIEIISPANKHARGRGGEEYRANQDRVLASRAGLVEIDLLRSGFRVRVAPPEPLRWDEEAWADALLRAAGLRQPVADSP